MSADRNDTVVQHSLGAQASSLAVAGYGHTSPTTCATEVQSELLDETSSNSPVP